jgi:hypothetical protein
MGRLPCQSSRCEYIARYVKPAFQPWKMIRSSPSGPVTMSWPPGPRTEPANASVVISGAAALVYGPRRRGDVA